ncbi:hypothetical protein BD413DRAFT_570126 [Trametes elegans]|nr:hypothetical protein BD413DRAFT_570126 [Trametes elegans]
MNHPNALNHAATTSEGHNIVVRVVQIGKEGENHLRVLRRTACGPSSLLTNNHAVPLWREVHFEDIVFGVFPFVGARLSDCYMPYNKNSVGDILDMLLQCLDALAYAHSLGIMHCDADKENFLVQWHPESLATMTVPIVRPRVHLTISS